jgi:hypothetical protein
MLTSCGLGEVCQQPSRASASRESCDQASEDSDPPSQGVSRELTARLVAAAGVWRFGSHPSAVSTDAVLAHETSRPTHALVLGLIPSYSHPSPDRPRAASRHARSCGLMPNARG